MGLSGPIIDFSLYPGMILPRWGRFYVSGLRQRVFLEGRASKQVPKMSVEGAL